jgi:short-subunit dehydrogenase
MGINFWGMVYGSKAFLPHLLQQEEAWLANVSSIFGIISVLTQGTYNSTKFAIRGFTEALWQELHHSPVHVASIHPGGIRTNIARYGRYDAQTIEDADRLKNNFDKLARTSPEKAAQVILRGLKKKKKRILIGNDAKVLSLMQRIFPVGYAKIVRSQYKGSVQQPQ